MAHKISRRSFLKWSGISVGSGIALGASSKQLQLSNLVLASGEAAEADGKEEWRHTACAMCLMCPMQVKVKNEKIIDVQGEDIYPWKGKVCAKAYGGIWGRVYAPDRILHPLKRVGERGEGKFVRCTWDEVINATATKIKEYIDAGHPEWYETWWGCPVQTDNMYFLHYWARITGTSISYMHGQICFGDNTAEKSITFGSNRAGDLVGGTADFLNCKYAVIAAQNFPGAVFTPGTTCGSSAFLQVFLKARENGFKYTLLDPKLTDSGALADDWLPIKPGTDAVFAMAIANVLLQENLYDEDFLLTYTNAAQLINSSTHEAIKDSEGNYMVWDDASNSAVALIEAGTKQGALGIGKTYDVNGVQCQTALGTWANMVAKYTPEKAIEICEMPFSTAKIYEIAHNLGYNKPSVIFSAGFTTGRYANWFQTLRCYSLVNLLLGNIERPGGWYFPKKKFGIGTGWPTYPEVPEYPDPELQVVPGPGGNVMSIKSLDKVNCYSDPPKYHPATVALPWEHFDAIKAGNVKALFSTAENSAITQVDTTLVYECLHKLELIVVGEQLPKEFVELADYVIPEASYVERNHLYTFTALGQDGQEHPTAIMRSAAIPPQGESQPVSWFYTEIGKRLGLGAYFENIDQQYGYWDPMLKKAGLSVTPKDLVEKGPYQESIPMKYDVLSTPIPTRSKRFEVYSNELAENCYYHPNSSWKGMEYVDPLPYYIPIVNPQKDDEFYLISGKATWHQKNATQDNRYLMESGIEGGCPYMPLYLNSQRAEEMGIKENDIVELECIGPVKSDEVCIYDDSNIGFKDTVRVHLSEGLHPAVAFTHFASGHKSNLMISKVQEGIVHSEFVPLTVEPYGGGCGKNYSIVKIKRVGV